MKRILVMGGHGQDAYYITKLLLEKGIEVHLIHRSRLNFHDKIFDSNNFCSFQCEDYNLDAFIDISYSHVLLISGFVGNRLAIEQPLKVFDSNYAIGRLALEFCQNSRYAPILVYFSTTDVSSNLLPRRNGLPIFSFNHLFSPKTSYGRSKVAVGADIKSSRDKGRVKASILYFSMHESLRRHGDYLLSKIKGAISGQLSASQCSLGNLNVGIDIGHAYEYMKIVRELLINDCFGCLDFAIGTGQKTNLYLLCQDILLDNNINMHQFFELGPQSNHEILTPIVDIEWMHKYKLIPPTPLTSRMLKLL